MVDELARVLSEQCLYYALPRRKRLELEKEIEADFSKVARAMKIVKDVFVDFDARHPSRASEVAEVLAYCIAQTHLSAPQVAAKMALKTSANMPVHGLDGIHAAFEGDALTIYFLEAKLAADAAKGARRYAKSAAEFLSDQKQYHREYQLVGDLGHLDSLVGEARQAAIDYFDIWNKPQLPRRERYVGVICHSEPTHFADVLPITDGPVEVHEIHFTKMYAADRARHRATAHKAILNRKGVSEKVILFFVAVPDINRLREAFYDALGLAAPPALTEEEDDVEDETVLMGAAS
ncbi:DUF1837 domain-containing protein [Brevundimonas sp.]|uniref:HamA C-terminal domain-containing protein n=1 Tax=Brevundimonas sp. TaxID=1871086 RepID=UPI00269423B1|nr:DUF1837 domain-containing protein [Brevundimonas sp.]